MFQTVLQQISSRIRPFSLSPLEIGVIGLFVGAALGFWFLQMSLRERRLVHRPIPSDAVLRVRALAIAVTTSILFTVLSWVEQYGRWLDTSEVQPSAFGLEWRLYFHLVLLSLLVVATAIDFDGHIIPDEITLPAMCMAVCVACAAGDFQISHLWVDWSTAIPQLRGPDIPGWYAPHPHFHGLSWSLVGLLSGAILTYVARDVSSRVLGQEAMGLGDVTLMAMIGAFLGWQAVILVFLLAPLAGLTVGVAILFLSGKPYLPYGPWLSIATLVVLVFWGWLWEKTRVIFSDWLSLVVLGGIGLSGLVVLLWLVKLYRAIPVRSPRSIRN